MIILLSSTTIGQHKPFKRNGHTTPTRLGHCRTDPIFWACTEYSLVFSANQICQIWREVRELRTSGVGPAQRSRFLVLTKRSAASGDENATWPELVRMRTTNYQWNFKWLILQEYSLWLIITVLVSNSSFFNVTCDRVQRTWIKLLL